MLATLAQRRLLLPAAIALCLPALTRAGQEELNVDTAADATAQEQSPLQRSFNPGPLFQGVNAITDLLRGELKGMPPFFRDTVVTFKPRTYYLNQDRPDGTRSEAWALGGSLEYVSGRFHDRFQIGAELFTSQPLYAPADADGTLLLKPGQEGYTVLGQLYAKLRVGGDDIVTLGRREFSTPYVNRQFSRMTPNTFEAIALKGSFIPLRTQKFDYEVAYLSKVKLRDSDTFVPMSQAIPFATQDDGTVLAQALFTVDNWAFGVANYFTPQTLNIFYAEATWTPAVTWPKGFKLSGQFTDQAEVSGSGATFNGQLLSRNVGLRMTTASENAVYNFAVSTTDAAGGIISPWGSNPTYTNPVIKNSNRPGESAALFSVAYDFAAHGVPGLSASIILAAGWNARDPSTGQALSTQSELDLTLDYKVPKGVLNGLWLRLQHNQLHDSSTSLSGEATTEWRAIVYWEIPLI
jgi:hypothetical protein